jgi:lipoprotein NlpD
MMRIVLILLFLALTACGGGQAVAPVGIYSKQSSKSTKSTTPPKVYTVKKGDTLYSVSWRYGQDYKTLAKVNGIKSPYTIYVGQKLRFKPTKATRKTTTKTTSKNTSSKASTSNQSLKWRWPTNGNVISTYSKSAAGRKGIDISGKSGQQVISSASGKVVYSGNGLPRYGNLLIIKHNDVYLSAYAHNKTLLVKEGQWVKSGQKIATLGKSGTQQYQLHFEIRRNGKPVDPMRFLPKK